MPFDPRIAEAALALEQLDSEALVSLAADLLEAGSDGPSIRRMASLMQPSGYETDQLLPRLMDEGNLASITQAEACIRLSLQLASAIVEQNLDPLKNTARLERWFMTANYPEEMSEPGFLDEEVWVMMNHGGRTENEARDWALERLQAFVNANLTLRAKVRQ